MQGNLLFHIIKDIHILMTLLHVKYSIKGRTAREYKNHLILNTPEIIKYIEHSPVRAGLVYNSDQYRLSSAWARKNGSGLIPDESNITMLMKS